MVAETAVIPTTRILLAVAEVQGLLVQMLHLYI